MSTTTPLDMSLDDIIKANKKSNPRSRKPPSTSGPTRRFSNRPNSRTTPYSKPVQPSNLVRPASIETGTKLYISNLDYGVSNEDIKELFAEVGDIKRYTVHYDKSGRSEGTAEVVFARREDAVVAVKKYNNVQLDGKPMKTEIVGTNIGAKPTTGFNANGGGFRNQNTGPRGSQGRGTGVGRSRGGGRGARRGGGRGRGRGRGEKVTAEDLDADLEKYHTQSAMEEN